MDFSFMQDPAVIWFLVGLALVLAEFAIPGVVIVFFGVGAWVVALLCLFLDLGVLVEILIFLVISIAALVFLRRRFSPAAEVGVAPEDTHDFVGKVAVAQEEISGYGLGKVLFNGTLWRAKPQNGPIRKGTHVEIVGQDNLVLMVKPIEGAKEE